MSGHRVLHDMRVAPFMVPDPGDAKKIHVDRWGLVVPMTSGSSDETRILAAPSKPGLMVHLVLSTDGGGNITLTVTDGYNNAGDTSLVFADAGDSVTLVSVHKGSDSYWRLIASDGVANKVGFFGVTPASQQSHVDDPSGGTTVDVEARAAINSILSTLETFGFHATV